MAAALLIAAAFVCNVTHPIVTQAIDSLPDTELQLLYVPETLVDVGCLILNHTPITGKVVANIGPHALKAIRALRKYSHPEAEIRCGYRGSNPWNHCP